MTQQQIQVWADGTADTEAYYSEHRNAWIFVDHVDGDLYEVEEWIEVTLDHDHAPEPVERVGEDGSVYVDDSIDWVDCGLNQATIACDLEGRGKWVVDAEDYPELRATYGKGMQALRVGTREGEVLKDEQAEQYLTELVS